MFNPLKEISESIKGWNEHREQLYFLLTCLSAVLVVTKCATGRRPSDTLAFAAHGIGIDPVAKWLGASAPPAIAAENSIVADASLSAIPIAMTLLVFVPLIQTFGGKFEEFAQKAFDTSTGRTAATIWILLGIAAQYGDIGSALEHWLEKLSAIANWTFLALVFVGVIYVIAMIIDRLRLANFLFVTPLNYAARIAVGFLISLAATLFAAVSVPLSIIFWAFGSSSNRRLKATS